MVGRSAEEPIGLQQARLVGTFLGDQPGGEEEGESEEEEGYRVSGIGYRAIGIR